MALFFWFKFDNHVREALLNVLAFIVIISLASLHYAIRLGCDCSRLIALDLTTGICKELSSAKPSVAKIIKKDRILKIHC